MSEQQPETNHQVPAPETPAPEEPSGFERLLAIAGIVAGVALIIMALDMATGGRLLGFADQAEPGT